jgi:hypothetical protein
MVCLILMKTVIIYIGYHDVWSALIFKTISLIRALLEFETTAVFQNSNRTVLRKQAGIYICIYI